jgi:hypothetical protein
LTDKSNISRDEIPQQGLLGRPLRGTFQVKVERVEKGGQSAIPLKTLLGSPRADETVWKIWSSFDNREHTVSIPDGNLRAYIANRPQEFGGDEVYVRVSGDYVPEVGENTEIDPEKLPPGLRDKLKEEMQRQRPSSPPQQKP